MEGTLESPVGIEPYEAVSGRDVLRAAKTYLHPDRIVSSIVADMEKAGLK